MADGVTTQTTTLATIPDATKIATDDAGAAGHVQIVKLALSADGSATALTADNTDGLLVNLGANNDVTVSGVSTAANQSTIIGHVDGIETLLGTIDADTSTLAGAVAGTEMQVDVLTMPTVAVTGTFYQATQPVSGTVTAELGATDNAVLDAIAASVAGATPAGTNNIGDVDVLTVPAPLSTTGTGTEATALRVTIATDSTGVLSVDDNGSTISVDDGGGILTVDGTVAVSGTVTVAGAVTNAGTFAVQVDGAALTSLQLLDDAISGSEMQVDVVGALPAGTNAIGKLAANSGVDIGDVDVTSIVLPTANTTSAVTSVADIASSTTLLSAAGTRKGFRITNTSSAVLYVKYGTTASASDFTARMPQWAYLEENFYSGRVDGIWASDPGDGAALITSLSA